MREMPEIYRKKIILNRPSRKYNNKYFNRLSESKPYVCIKGHLK
jgi:hypothetical protein